MKIHRFEDIEETDVFFGVNIQSEELPGYSEYEAECAYNLWLDALQAKADMER